MAFPWLVNRGDPNHLRPSWDDPPSRGVGRFLYASFGMRVAPPTWMSQKVRINGWEMG